MRPELSPEVRRRIVGVLEWLCGVMWCGVDSVYESGKETSMGSGVKRKLRQVHKVSMT
jgi:hypothetical protein